MIDVVLFSLNGIDWRSIDKYMIVSQLISEEFLSFAKNHLTNSQADPNNYPRFSSTFLRVPGTINTKRKYGHIEIV